MMPLAAQRNIQHQFLGKSYPNIVVGNWCWILLPRLRDQNDIYERAARQVEFACAVDALQLWRVCPMRGKKALSLPTVTDANDAGRGSTAL